jgi:hypothetical protein
MTFDELNKHIASLVSEASQDSALSTAIHVFELKLDYILNNQVDIVSFLKSIDTEKCVFCRYYYKPDLEAGKDNCIGCPVNYNNNHPMCTAIPLTKAIYKYGKRMTKHQLIDALTESIDFGKGLL